MKNMRGWSVYCGFGSVEMDGVAGMLCLEEHTNLTKAEALSMAEKAAKHWPRVFIGQKSARYPKGVTIAGISYGRKFGKIFEGGEDNA